MSTYPKRVVIGDQVLYERVVIGDQVLYVMDKAQEARFIAECAERTRLNSQPMPKRLKDKLINSKK